MGHFVSNHTQNLCILETYLGAMAVGREERQFLMAMKQELEDPSCYLVVHG